MIYIRQDLLVINELLPGDKLLIIILRATHLCTLFPDVFIQGYSNNYKPVKDLWISVINGTFNSRARATNSLPHAEQMLFEINSNT